MTPKLKEQFSSLNNTKVLMVRPGGNWGDHLIYFGAEHCAKECGIQFESLTKEQFLQRKEIDENDTVYIHGGGALNEWCSDSAFVCLKHAVSNYKRRVIYGPNSCTTNVDFLESKLSECLDVFSCESLLIYAREAQTYGIYTSLNAFNIDNVTIGEDVDTAFHLTKEAVLERIGPEKHQYDLLGFREDNEVGDTRHTKNLNNVILDPPYFSDSFEHWLRVHAYARSIVTNRTHSSIIGAILDKPTTLFAGRYHKNRSIWEKTLKDMGVKWAGNEVVNLAKDGLWDKVLPSKIKSSWKVQRLHLYLSGVPLK